MNEMSLIIYSTMYLCSLVQGSVLPLHDVPNQRIHRKNILNLAKKSNETTVAFELALLQNYYNYVFGNFRLRPRETPVVFVSNSMTNFFKA